MGSDRHGALIRAALALLERERACLLRGDLSGVAALAREKETLAAAFAEAAGRADPAAIAALRDRAARNRDLLEAAMQGIRRVSARLSAYRQVQRSMDTYDPQGRRATIAGASMHRLERRA